MSSIGHINLETNVKQPLRRTIYRNKKNPTWSCCPLGWIFAEWKFKLRYHVQPKAWTGIVHPVHYSAVTVKPKE